jgi:hypothetical protein
MHAPPDLQDGRATPGAAVETPLQKGIINDQRRNHPQA